MGLVKKVKPNAKMIKKYALPIGKGDMDEHIYVAVDFQGNPIEPKELDRHSFTVKAFHCLELEEEFLVVDHINPIAKDEYDRFKMFFGELND